MAKWMPLSSRPGIGRSRGFSAPPVSTTASCSFTSLSTGSIDADIDAVMEDHAFGLHLRDAAVDVDLLHLEVGDAVAQQPAGLGPASRRRAPHGRRARAAARRRGPPAPSRPPRPSCRSCSPAPRASSPCAMARSAISHSIVLMVTGFSSMLSVQEASHGAGQTRPVTSGKLLVECRLRAASSQWPR